MSFAGLYTDLGTGERAVATGVENDPFGPPTGWTYGNGVARDYVRDLDGRITELSAGVAPTLRQKLTYQHDIADRITQITNGIDASRTQVYAYDVLDRLLRATTEWFGYDANGNRVAREKDAALSQYAIAPDSNRLSALTGGETAAFTYNANGNATAWSQSGQSHTAIYDAMNRLDEAHPRRRHDRLRNRRIRPARREILGGQLANNATSTTATDCWPRPTATDSGPTTSGWATNWWAWCAAGSCMRCTPITWVARRW